MHESDPSIPLGTLLSSVCPVACNICQRESWQDALAAIRTSPIKNGDFDADTVTDSRGYVYDAPSYWRSGGNVVMVQQSNRPWGGLSSNSGANYI